MHKHITREDRACIAHLLRNKESYEYIASVIGVHRTTILREIERNSENGFYDARVAQRKACLRRRHAKVSFRVLDTNTKLRN